MLLFGKARHYIRSTILKQSFVNVMCFLVNFIKNCVTIDNTKLDCQYQ